MYMKVVLKKDDFTVCASEQKKKYFPGEHGFHPVDQICISVPSWDDIKNVHVS